MRLVGGVSVAGLRPGFGLGGITHSFCVIIDGVDNTIGLEEPLLGFTARVCGAGARAAGPGEPAEDGVDTAGEAMLLPLTY